MDKMATKCVRTISVSNASRRLCSLIDEVNESHKPVLLVGKNRSAYLVPEEDWRAIQETLYLMSIPGMAESIQKGMETPIEECSGEPGW